MNYSCSASNLGVPDFDDHATVSVMSPAGFFGGVFHELMHIAGFTHQQNRFDRDKAIFINYAYVEKGDYWRHDFTAKIIQTNKFYYYFYSLV